MIAVDELDNDKIGQLTAWGLQIAPKISSGGWHHFHALEFYSFANSSVINGLVNSKRFIEYAKLFKKSTILSNMARQRKLF